MFLFKKDFLSKNVENMKKNSYYRRNIIEQKIPFVIHLKYSTLVSFSRKCDFNFTPNLLQIKLLE